MAAENADVSARDEANDIMDEEFAGLTDDAVETIGTDDEPIETDEPLDDAATDDGDHDLQGEEDAPVEGVNRGDGRDAKGKFAPSGEPDQATSTATSTATEQAPAAGQATAAAEVPAPAFQPLKIRADKEDVAIPEAQITEANGFVMLGVKKEDWNRFSQRISRGVVAEKVWQRLTQKEREIDAERSAPLRKSDAEIEAELMLETLRPHLPELLDPLQMENLELKVKHAQRNYADEYGQQRAAHVEQALKTSTPEEEVQAATLQGLAHHLVAFREQSPELRDLTDDELRQAYADLAPVQRAVFWKEGDGFLANNQLIAQRLVAIKQQRVAKATGNGALPSGTTATAGASSTPRATATDGDRFNRGVDSGKKPGSPSTTSLKANRGTASVRSRDSRNTRSQADPRSRVKTPELDAEEAWRKKTRTFLSSDSLDFDDGE